MRSLPILQLSFDHSTQKVARVARTAKARFAHQLLCHSAKLADLDGEARFWLITAQSSRKD
jgi:hypothetical protein